MSQRHSGRERAAGDYYSEPPACAKALFNTLGLFPGGFHDPCVGRGTIVDVGLGYGCTATGADLCDRAAGRFSVRDFLEDHQRYPNVVTNPPFNLAVDFVVHALELVTEGGRVAILAPSNFLYSQSRYRLFSRTETDAIVFLSRRPSVPPGTALELHGEAIRGHGSVDFCWIVWQQGRSRWPCRAFWAAP
jgi:hypothetical protein